MRSLKKHTKKLMDNDIIGPIRPPFYSIAKNARQIQMKFGMKSTLKTSVWIQFSFYNGEIYTPSTT
jgi:hypothetical protein